MSEGKAILYKCGFMDGQACKFDGKNLPTGAWDFPVIGRLCRQLMSDDADKINCDEKQIVTEEVVVDATSSG